MDRTPVISSMIKSVGYDPAREMLEIEFNNGSIYEAAEVPAEAGQGMMEAAAGDDSVGRYFNKNIKNNFNVVMILEGTKGEAEPPTGPDPEQPPPPTEPGD